MGRMFWVRLSGIGLLVLIGSLVAYVEAHHAIPHFRLISFGLVFLFLGLATAIAPARARSVVLVAASLAFGLALVEAAATLKERKSDLIGNLEMGARTPIVGWDNGAAGTYPYRRVDLQSGAVIFDATYTIDAHHDRVTKSTQSGRSVVFLGDSLTFGDGVNDHETMPQQFADLLGGRQKVLNLGVGGWSPSQVLAELQNGLKDDVIGKDPLAFVMLTGSFHIERTACKESWTIRAPRYERKDGRLVFVGACAENATAGFRRFLENTAAYRVFVKPLRLRLSPDDIETYIDIVAEVSRIAKTKYGVDILVPYTGGPVTAPKSVRHAQIKVLPFWAYLEGTGYDDDKILAELRSRGVRTIDVTLRDEAMSGHQIGIPGDGHPTPFAHAQRAKMILAAFQSMGIALEGSRPTPHVRLSDGEP